MNLFIWLFFFSLALILLMLLYRVFEIKTGKEIVSENFRLKIDKKILSSIVKFKIKITSINLHFRLKVIDCFHICNNYLHQKWQKYSDKIEKYFEKMKYQKQNHKKSSISMYWKEVNNHKNIIRDFLNKK